jgi:hypothetical protein
MVNKANNKKMTEETKQLTENQLALFLDCQALFTYAGEPNPMMTAAINYDRLIAYSKGGFDSIKPILRPLRDITEEEAKHIYHSIKNYQSEKSVKEDIEYMTEKDPDYKWSYVEQFNTCHEYYEPILYNDAGNSSVWFYLLSRGFDLFNWIEQGLAIDKTASVIATDTPQRREE